VIGPEDLGGGDLATFAQRIEGDEAGGQLGASLAIADLDRDGIDDLAIGCTEYNSGGPGELLLFRGPVAGPLTPADADAVVAGANRGDHFGAAMAAGDIDADGSPDLVVSADLAAAGRGKVYLLTGADLFPTQ
jgi:hypothetical protein